MSWYFPRIIRGTQSITIDVKTKSGRRLVRNIAGKSDVGVENFRLGVADRLGISLEQLHEKDTPLVRASLTDFGQDAPARDRPALEIITQAMSVVGRPDAHSTRVEVPIVDIVAGMCTSTGVPAGMQGRKGTGEGCHIEVAMIDSQLAMLSYLASSHSATGQILGRRAVDIGTPDVPDGRRDRVVGSAIEVNGEPDPRVNPPAQGEHTDEILHTHLGWDADRVAAAAAGGAFDVEETK